MLSTKKSPFSKIILPEKLIEKYQSSNATSRVEHINDQLAEEINHEQAIQEKSEIQEEQHITEEARFVFDEYPNPIKNQPQPINYVEIVIKDEKENFDQQIPKQNIPIQLIEEVTTIKAEEESAKIEPKEEVISSDVNDAPLVENFIEPKRVFSTIDESFNKITSNNEEDILNNPFLETHSERQKKIESLKSPTLKSPSKIKSSIDETKNSLNKKISELKKDLGLSSVNDYKKDHDLKTELNDNLELKKYFEETKKDTKMMSSVDLQKLNLYDLIVYLNKVDVKKLSYQEQKRIAEVISIKVSYIKNLVNHNNDKNVIKAAKNVINALIKTLNNMRKKRKSLLI